MNGKPCKFQVALVTKSGTAFGGIVTLDSELKDYKLSLGDLKLVKLVTLPRPYPTFLPYYFSDSRSDSFDISNTESLQVSIGPGIPEDEFQQQHGISIESIRVE